MQSFMSFRLLIVVALAAHCLLSQTNGFGFNFDFVNGPFTNVDGNCTIFQTVSNTERFPCQFCFCFPTNRWICRRMMICSRTTTTANPSSTNGSTTTPNPSSVQPTPGRK